MKSKCKIIYGVRDICRENSATALIVKGAENILKPD